MQTLLSLSLYLHIAAGFVSLATGMVAAIARKRRGLHSRVGKVYFIAMAVVFVTAVVLAIAKSNPFLFGVGLFSFYLCLSGYKSAHWKGQAPKLLSVLLPVLGTGGAVILFFTGHLVAIVFGLILLLNIGIDVLSLAGWLKPSAGKLAWMFSHAGRMGGSYIATFTAFVVTNVQLEAAPWLPWLLPTVIGSALITRWNVRMRRQLKKAEAGSTLSK